jgi:hypothetical protein
MVDIYKPPHTKSPKTMAIFSTTSRLDQLETQVTTLNEKHLEIQQSVASWNQKLDSLKKSLSKKLTPMKAHGILEVEQWNSQHIKPHQEEISNSRLFSYS